MTYTTTTEVAAELGGITITSTSSPSTTQVTSWIRDAEAEINSLTGMSWNTQSLTGSVYEYHDYKGNNRLILNNAPVISITKVEYISSDWGAPSVTWTELTEGRTSSDSFIVYKDEGLIQFHNNTSGTHLPKRGVQNVRVQYSYGKATVPNEIKRFATLLVAKRYMLSVASKTASEEGGAVSVGTISVDDPNNYVHNHYDRVTKEIEYYRKQVIGSFKPYIYDNNIYD